MNADKLEYFKQKLLTLKKETEAIINKDLIDANDSKLPDDNDLASVQYEQGFAIKMRSRNIKYLKKIDKALQSIEDKTYGECLECGNEISFERLDARVVATVCFECKQEIEREEKHNG